MIQNSNQTRKQVSIPAQQIRNQQSNIILEGYGQPTQVHQLNRAADKSINISQPQQANFSSQPNNSTQIKQSTSVLAQGDHSSGGASLGQVGLTYPNMQQIYSGPRPAQPPPPRYVTQQTVSSNHVRPPSNHLQRQNTPQAQQQAQQQHPVYPIYTSVFLPQQQQQFIRVPNSNTPMQYQIHSYPNNTPVTFPYAVGVQQQPVHQVVTTPYVSYPSSVTYSQASTQQGNMIQSAPRKKNIISIIDPSTGKTLNEEIVNSRQTIFPTPNEEISKTQSSNSNENNKIVQEFAAKVSAVARNKEFTPHVITPGVENSISSPSLSDKNLISNILNSTENETESDISNTKDEIKPCESVPIENTNKNVNNEVDNDEQKDDELKKKSYRKKEAEEQNEIKYPDQSSQSHENNEEIMKPVNKLENDETKQIEKLIDKEKSFANDNIEINTAPDNLDLQEDDTSKSDISIIKKLKYDYKEHQWSPINLEGKKQYDRTFLMQLQFDDLSKLKPKDLPNLDIILAKSVTDNPTSPENSRPDIFTPQYLNKGNRTNYVKKNPKPAQKVIIPKVEVPELNTIENPYKPRIAKGSKSNILEDEDEELFRIVRGILNKLTPQNFNKLIEKFKTLQINTESKMIGVIRLIFEKAIDEPAFSVAYGNLCRVLSNLLQNIKIQSADGKEFSFRSGLLTRCQEQFEKNKGEDDLVEKRRADIEKAQTENEKQELLLRLEEDEAMAKRKYLGNIRFIGELFKLKMLTENIMHCCLFELLKSHDEEKLECLCKLMRTIGKECDHTQAKNRMDQYFQQMNKIIEQKKVCSRVRFMLQDVIDLRLNNWTPRRDENAPKTIAQVRQEMERELQKKDDISQQHMHNQKNRRHNPTSRNQTNSQQNEDGWQQQNPYKTNQRNNDFDRGRMLNMASSKIENIPLGPSRPKAWGLGASGGRNQTTQDDSAATQGVNRFSALSQSQAEESRQINQSKPPTKSGSAQLNRRSQHNYKLVSRASEDQSRAKQEAIETARSINKQQSEQTSTSRDSSRSRSSQRSSVMSNEELDNRIKTMVDEYLQLHDIKDSMQYIKEMLDGGSKAVDIVDRIINSILERSEEARRQIGELINNLVLSEKTTIDHNVLMKATIMLLECSEDMEIDIPKIWQYIAELYVPVLVSKTVSFKDIYNASKTMKHEKLGILFSTLLHTTASVIGPQSVHQLWQKSGLNWDEMIPAADVFIKKNKLEFTVESSMRSRTSSEKKPVRQLSDSVRKVWNNKSAEKIFSWIEENITEEDRHSDHFIFNLFYGLCEYCTDITGMDTPQFNKDKYVSKEFTPVLQMYLDVNVYRENLEMVALKTIQRFSNDLQHPAMLFKNLLELFYDEELISEEAFLCWNKKDNNEPGYGVCKMSSNQFFQWLNNENR